MGQTIHELRAVVSSYVDGFVEKMNRGIGATENFARAWTKAGADIDRVASRVGVVVGGMAAGVAAATTKMGFSFLQSRDSAEIMLGTILKDSALAKKTLDDLFEAAKKTPFSFEGLKDGMVQLANAKVAAANLIHYLYKISDAVAAVGGSDADIKGVTYALSQMMTAGKLNAQDVMQLTNRGIAGWDILAEKTGRTVAEVRKLSESGAIDGRLAAEAIIEGMGERFAGAGDRLSQKFQGMLSSVKDMLWKESGTIVEPLYDAMSRVMGSIVEGMNNGSAAGGIQRIRSAVADLATALEQLVSGGGTDFIQRVTDGFVYLINVGTNLTNWIRTQGPALVELADSWGELLAPIMEFISVHPELIAAFLFFKGGQMLGVNQAIMSVGSAISSVVSQVGLMNAGLMTLQAGGVALAIAAILTFASALYEANLELQGLNREIVAAEEKRGVGLDTKVTKNRSDKYGRVINQSRRYEQENGADTAKVYLQEQLKIAERNMLGAQGSVAGARKNYEEEAAQQTLLDTMFGGDKLALQKKAELADAEQSAKAATDFYKQIKAELERVSAAPAATSGGTSNALTESLANKLDEKDAAAAEKQQKKADAKEANEAKRRLEQTDDMLADFGRKFYELRKQLNPAEIGLASDRLREVSEAYKEGELNAREYQNELSVVSKWMDDRVKASNAMGDFVNNSDSTRDRLLESGASGSVMSEFETASYQLEAEVAKLTAKFLDGTINAHEFQTGVQSLNKDLADASQRAQQATNVGTEFDKKIVDQQSDMEAKISKGQFSQGSLDKFNSLTDGIRTKISELAREFQAGDITSSQFAVGVERLRQEMQAATDAANEQEKVERRQMMLRLMEGAGTKEDYKRLNAMQQGAYWDQFDKQLTSTFDAMFGLGQAAQTVVSGFDTLNQGMQNFDQQLSQATTVGRGGGGSVSVGQAFDALSNLFNSIQGQAALLHNNIEMMRQAQSFANTYQQWKSYQDQIDAFQRQLSSLRAPPPLAIATSWETQYGPTAQMGYRGYTPQVGHLQNEFNLTFPNWNPQNPADVRAFADSLLEEMDRRGNRVYT